MDLDEIKDAIELIRLKDFNMTGESTGVSREEILLLLKKYSQNIRNKLESVDLDQAVKEYVNIYSDIDGFDESSLRIYLRPVTKLDVYKLPSYRDLIDSYRFNLISAFDASSHSPRGHGEPTYMLVTMGYSVWGLSDIVFNRNAHIPFFILIKNYELDLRLIEKYVEYSFLEGYTKYLKDISEEYGFKGIYILFDESFNLSYTYSFAKDIRDSYIELYKAIFNELDRLGIIYGGVFYSGATTLSKYLVEKGFIKNEVRDRHIMDKYLDDSTYSQVFKVESESLDEHGLEIYTMFMKLGSGNILRIEFPKSIYSSRKFLDLLRIVYLDAIRGDGYPYLLARAHENCVLRGDIRRFIEVDVSTVLTGSYLKSISRKNIRKWRRLV